MPTIFGIIVYRLHRLVISVSSFSEMIIFQSEKKMDQGLKFREFFWVLLT